MSHDIICSRLMYRDAWCSELITRGEIVPVELYMPINRGDLCLVHTRRSIGYCFTCKRLYCEDCLSHSEHTHILFSDYGVSATFKPQAFDIEQISEVNYLYQLAMQMNDAIKHKDEITSRSFEILDNMREITACSIQRAFSSSLAAQLQIIINKLLNFDEEVDDDYRKIKRELASTYLKLERFGFSDPVANLIEDKRSLLYNPCYRNTGYVQSLKLKNAFMLFDRVVFRDDNGQFTLKYKGENLTDTLDFDFGLRLTLYRDHIELSISEDRMPEQPIDIIKSFDYLSKMIDPDTHILWFINTCYELIAYNINDKEVVYRGSIPINTKRLLTIFEAPGLVICADENDMLWYSYPLVYSMWRRIDRTDIKEALIYIGAPVNDHVNGTFVSSSFIYRRKLDGKHATIPIKCIVPWYSNGRIYLLNENDVNVVREQDGVLI